MKHKFISIFLAIQILLLVGMTTSALAQTYNNPPYQTRTNPRVDIEKVVTDKKYTIVYLKYQSTFSGHACIDGATYIEDARTKKRYPLIKAQGIPVCPQQRVFTKAGVKFTFRLYFGKLPYSATSINLIEDMTNGFNFKKIYLKPSA